MKGLNPRNQWVRIASPATGGEEVLLHIEAASNPVLLDYHPFLPTQLGDKDTAGDAPQYTLTRMDLAISRRDVWELVQDLEVLGELMVELPEDSAPLRHPARRRAAPWTPSTCRTSQAPRPPPASGCADVARRARRRHRAPHLAVGHAHIDSAWLWPLRETVRKVARTTSNVIALHGRTSPTSSSPCPQAQQYAWIKEHRPEVFARVKKAVAEGRFVPVGRHVGGVRHQHARRRGDGPPVRPRQAVLPRGVRHRDRGGRGCPTASATPPRLPQIVKRRRRRKWFLTQKISWNQINKFPHHTFRWEGIDGTRVFTHFPPVDTYNSRCSPGSELAHAGAQLPGEGPGNRLAAPIGWGDGGGGTTREMIAAAGGPRDLEGSPTVTIGARPREFFDARPRPSTRDPPVWVGELYLELHRATLTRRPRPSRATGAASTCCARRSCGRPPPPSGPGTATRTSELDRLWKTVLLHQFHDILPGTLDRLGAPRGRARPTPASPRSSRRSSPAAQRALAGDGDAAARLQRRARTPATACRPVARGRRRGVRPAHGRPLRRGGRRLRARQRPVRVGDRRARPGHLGRRPRRAAARRSPRARRPTCCSCTRTSRTGGTPGTSTGSTATRSPT